MNTMAKITLKISAAIGGLGFVLCLNSPAQTLSTPAEEANYLQYSQHEDVARFLGSLAFLAKEVKVLVIGKTKDVKGESCPPENGLYSR